MRISTSTLTKMMTGSMGNAYETYANIMTKIASKKNFTKMSENPTDATKVIKLKEQLAQMDNYQSNIKAAMNEMNFAYDTLGDVEDEITSIHSLALQASTGTTSTSEAQAFAAEIKEKVESVKNKMNSKYLDSYVFSGSYTKTKPYVTDTNGDVTYEGSTPATGERHLTIAEGKTITYNFTGEEILKGKNGTTEFFAEMKELDELLNADTLDFDKIREKLGILEDVSNNITQAQGMISAKVSSLNAASEENEKTIIKLTEDRSELEDLDIIKAASDLTAAQQALQASYAMSSQILSSVSLLDYI